MSELHTFLFEGLPVRGVLVRLTESWQELLRRREAGGGFEEPVRRLLGEMSAATVLLQSNIKFNGAVVLQIFGDGPVKLAVTEAQPDLAFRSTAKVVGEIPSTDSGSLPLEVLVNNHGKGRCAITLDPKDRQPGQQPYQGVVSLNHVDGGLFNDLSDVLEQYMRKSEQLDAKLVLAANDEIAAGLLIQRMPIEGEANLAGTDRVATTEEELDEAYNRIATLAASLKREELLTLDAETILRRLFWQEPTQRFEPLRPRFACSCSRERVGNMLLGLGRTEVDEVVAELGGVEIGCDFCGTLYHFDAVDVGELFTATPNQAPGSSSLQ